LGPLSFLLLGKTKDSGATPLHLIDRLIPVYEELLQRLAAEGADWVQIDEPTRAALVRAVTRFAGAAPQIKILLAAYFGPLGDNLAAALRLPIHALHLDLVRGSNQLEPALQNVPDHLTLSLGLVDGRNIWKTDLAHALETAERAFRELSPHRVMIAPSCSLLHVPVDLSLERKLSPEVKDWMAVGRQKLDEVAIIARALNEGHESVRAELNANAESLRKRRGSP